MRRSSSSALVAHHHQHLWPAAPPSADPLLPPRFISYSPDGAYAALGYKDAIELYALATSLLLITRIAASQPRDALWNKTTLFVSSDTTISAHFIVPPAPPDKQLVQLSSMATASGSDGLPPLTGLPTAASYEVQSIEIATTKVSRGRALASFGAQPELPPVTLRPGALWRLVAATETTLWLCSSAGHAWAVALTHAGYQCRALALKGELREARLRAAGALHPRHHDGLARFLSAFGSDGAAEALLLPGALCLLLDGAGGHCQPTTLDWQEPSRLLIGKRPLEY